MFIRCDRIFFNKTEVLSQLKYGRVPQYCQSDHKPIYGIFKCLASKVKLDKKEEVAKKLRAGLLDHWTKDMFNQNLLLSFHNLKRKTNFTLGGGDDKVMVNNEDDPWVEEEDTGWGLANEIANSDHTRISQIFSLYNSNVNSENNDIN